MQTQHFLQCCFNFEHFFHSNSLHKPHGFWGEANPRSFLELFVRLKWEVWCQIQTIFLVSTHLCFLVVLDEYFLSNIHGLCCCTGKTPERKKESSIKSLLAILPWFIFITTKSSNIFFLFLCTWKEKMFLEKRKLVKSSGWKSLICTFLKTQEKRGLMTAARLRELDKSRLGK